MRGVALHSAGALTVPDELGVVPKAGGSGGLSLGSVRICGAWPRWRLELGRGLHRAEGVRSSGVRWYEGSRAASGASLCSARVSAWEYPGRVC